jgi:hypothetical protein
MENYSRPNPYAEWRSSARRGGLNFGKNLFGCESLCIVSCPLEALIQCSLWLRLRHCGFQGLRPLVEAFVGCKGVPGQTPVMMATMGILAPKFTIEVGSVQKLALYSIVFGTTQHVCRNAWTLRRSCVSC